jgi:uncharacterized RDD family membrane protein YckC
MAAERMPPHKSDLVALELPAEPVDNETRPAPSRLQRIADRWPAAAIMIACVLNLVWVIWLLWLLAGLIF